MRLSTDAEHQQHADARRPTGQPHRFCVLIRELRQAAQLSLADFRDRFGIQVGGYERGDRVPPLDRLEEVLGCFGYQLSALPSGSESTRRRADMVADLRAIADQLEGSSAGPQ